MPGRASTLTEPFSPPTRSPSTTASPPPPPPGPCSTSPPSSHATRWSGPWTKPRSSASPAHTPSSTATHGKAGAATLRTLLLTSRSPTPTRTELEARFLTFLDDWGFERPLINTVIEGYEVDAAWRDARLIVELDGFETHGTRRSFERDRERDRRLTTAGWRRHPP